MSGFFGSTVSFSKYQPRPHSARSDDVRVHVVPPSSERKNPPCIGTGGAPRPGPPAGGAGAGGAPGSGTRQSTTAYTRWGLLGAIATPQRPMPSAGRPAVSCFHVSPPSLDL